MGRSFPSRNFPKDCKNCSRVGLRAKTLLLAKMIPARRTKMMITIQTILSFLARMDIVLVEFPGDLGGHQGADIDRIRVIFDRIHLSLFMREIDQVHPVDRDIHVDLLDHGRKHPADILDENRDILSRFCRDAHRVVLTALELVEALPVFLLPSASLWPKEACRKTVDLVEHNDRWFFGRIQFLQNDLEDRKSV